MKNLFTLVLVLALSLCSLPLLSQNNALSFDGSNDHIVAGTINMSGSAITLEAWIYPRSFNDANDANISDILKDNSESCLLRIGDGGIENNRPQFVISNSGGQQRVNANTTLTANQWYHIAGVYDGSSMKIYINGVLDNELVMSGTIVGSSNNIYIAGNGSTPYGRYFDGIIDEARIWNDARTETEIRQNMFREIPNPAGEANLVVYYKCNETSGTTLYDSKSSNNGTLTNMAGTEWQTSAALFGPRNALDFDGSNDYVTIPANASLNNNTFTVEFWVKLDDTPASWDGIIDKGKYAAGNEWYFLTVDGAGYAPGARCIMFGIEGAGEIWMWVGDNNWHHFAGTYDGTEMKAYMDGALCGTVSYSSYTATTNAIRMGEDLAAYYHANIHLDEVRIWSDARTATELRDNMMKPLVGDEANLVAYYTMDNAGGTTIPDISGNGNNAIMYNMDAATDWVASSAYNSWLNTSSSSWSTASNWSRGSVPGATDNVGIYTYSGGTDVIINGSPSISTLLLGSSSSTTLSSDLNLNRNLVLVSNLNINGQAITLGSEGKLVEDIGMLYGTSGYIQITRDLNNISSDNVGGIGAEITTAANMGSTNIKCYYSSIPSASSNDGIKRYYVITPTTNTGLNATLVFHYRDGELNGNTEANLVLHKSSDNGVTWTQQGGSINTTENTITLAAIDGFSWWTAAEAGSTLPVELLDFYADCNGSKSASLHWSTASEQYSSHFEIQASYDGIEFTNIGEVSAAGNSNTLMEYEYIYSNTEALPSYYRLMQIDLDGAFEYSNTISLQCKEDQSKDINVYPNPFVDEIAIDLNNAGNGTKNIKLQNILGEVIMDVNIDASTSNYTMQLEEELQNGIYFIVVRSENERCIKKIIKK